MSQLLQSQSLCEFCSDILSRAFAAGEEHDDNLPVNISNLTGITARPDLDFIRQSASTGCRLCLEMLRVHSTKICNSFHGTTRAGHAKEALEVASQKFPRISVDVVFQEGLEDSRLAHYLLVYSHTIDEDVEDDHETQDENGPSESNSHDEIARPRFISGILEEEPETDDIFLQTLFNIQRSDYSSWTRFTAWLDHCTTSHDSCSRELFPTKALPKRLIDVGDENHPPALHLSENLPPDTEYVTLSHCWGKSKVITLTSSTSQIFSKSIPCEDLSQTFQDAISITRRLSTRYGIRHIWIDSLCILQDSKEEWLQEAPRMTEVYGNCWCNLAATSGAGDPSRPTGMYSQRSREVIEPIQISTPSVRYTIVDSERWTDFVKRSPLGQRAWVLQERLLSPRILHFGVDEIFWECSTGRASETFPRGEPEVDMVNLGAAEAPLRAQLEASSEETLNSWLEVVDTYTNCDLTYTGDKLFAIAGLAKHYKSKFGLIDYMAGLWRTGLERQLLWRVDSLGLTKRSETYRAPSWCWSSIDGPIWCTSVEEGGETLIEVLDAKISLADTDIFSSASSGSLRLKGRLFKGRAASDVYYFPGLRLSFDESINEVAYHPDDDLKLDSCDDAVLFCMPVLLKNVEDDDSVDDEEVSNKRKTAENEGKVRDMFDDGEVDVRIILQGLVLGPTHETKGQYRRLGTFETQVPDEVEKIIQTRMSRLEDLEYESFDGHGQYIISVV